MQLRSSYRLSRTDQRAGPAAEHGADGLRGVLHAGCVEQYEAERHKQEYIDVVQHVQLLKATQQKQLFRREQNRVQKPPQDKIPRRAVPQAGREPDEQDIQQLPALPFRFPPSGI